MIIWGWRTLLKTLSEGMFHCHNEGADRPYRLVSARRWFTLFFIPLIPLKQLGEFVECQVCKATYDPAVLTLPTNAEFQDALSGTVRHLLVAVLRAGGGSPSEAARSMAVTSAQQWGLPDYAWADLDHDLATLDPAALEDVLARTAGGLSTAGQENLLRLAVMLAAADGDATAHAGLLETIGLRLGLTPAHVHGVIATANVTDS